MHEKCKQCAKNNPDDEVRVQVFNAPYGCYDNTDNCHNPDFSDFEPIIEKKQEKGSCNHHECKECANRRVEFDLGSSTHLQQSCYNRIDDDPGLEIPDGWGWELSCDYKCPLYSKTESEPELVKEKPEFVKCQDCKHVLEIDKLDWGKCGYKGDRDCEYKTDFERECTHFVKREPALVKCVNCQNARDIVQSTVGKPNYKYMATCNVIREFYPFLNKERVCDKFVEKTCEGCKHEDKRLYGTCHASDVNPIANEKAGNPFYKCGVMDNQPELGRYAWESAEEAKVTCRTCVNAHDFDDRRCRCKTRMSTRWNLDDEWECRYYVPRSCENCGRGGWNNLCDFPLHEAIKCRNKTWRSWTPRVKDIPEKESSTAHYLTNDYISKRYFEGEPVPGDNTITEGRNEAIKNHVDMVLNTYLGFTEVINDETGILLHIAGELYHNGLEDKNIELTLDHERALETVRGIEYSKKLKTALENGDYVLIPSEESKENKKKNEEVTEMDKSEEKFPFTCPECGAGVYQRENYCMHCGHEFDKLVKHEKWFNIPEKQGRTRKAVRVRKYTPGSPESRAVSSSVAIAKILLQLGIVWFFGTITLSASINEIIKHFLAAVIGLGTFTTIAGFIGIPCLELVDVPRTPAMDRIRAWRQARKDVVKEKLSIEITKLSAEITGLNKHIDTIEDIVHKRDKTIDEWKQTAADITKQHEQDIKDLTEERDAMVNTILADRDANWIPLSNRLPAAIGADDITINVEGPYRTIDCTIYDRDGKLSKAIVDFTEIVLFSKNMLDKDGEE
jgi:hypothetical protein